MEPKESKKSDEREISRIECYVETVYLAGVVTGLALWKSKSNTVEYVLSSFCYERMIEPNMNGLRRPLTLEVDENTFRAWQLSSTYSTSLEDGYHIHIEEGWERSVAL